MRWMAALELLTPEEAAHDNRIKLWHVSSNKNDYIKVFIPQEKAMRFVTVNLVTIFALMSSVYAGNPACQGLVKVNSEDCGATITIGNKIIARCLDKTSPAFSAFLSECVHNREETLESNNYDPNAIMDIYGQCGGDLIFQNVKCGIHFFIKNRSNLASDGAYQSLCHDPLSTEDKFIKDIRAYCEKIGSSSAHSH
jgi:hypothetical protein